VVEVKEPAKNPVEVAPLKKEKPERYCFGLCKDRPKCVLGFIFGGTLTCCCGVASVMVTLVTETLLEEVKFKSE